MIMLQISGLFSWFDFLSLSYAYLIYCIPLLILSTP